MTPQELRLRTKDFAIRVKRFCRPLLRDTQTTDPARQLARASAATAANYRATCVARTPKEFVSRIGLVLEEADESVFWSRYLAETGLRSPQLDAILDEAHQLAKIFSASYRTARQNLDAKTKGRMTQ